MEINEASAEDLTSQEKETLHKWAERSRKHGSEDDSEEALQRETESRIDLLLPGRGFRGFVNLKTTDELEEGDDSAASESSSSEEGERIDDYDGPREPSKQEEPRAAEGGLRQSASTTAAESGGDEGDSSEEESVSSDVEESEEMTEEFSESPLEDSEDDASEESEDEDASSSSEDPEVGGELPPEELSSEHTGIEQETPSSESSDQSQDSPSDDGDLDEYSEETSLADSTTVIEMPSDDELEEIAYKRKGKKGYRKRERGIGKCLTRLCPFIAVVLLSKRREYRSIKAMFGFPIGLLFGYMLHKLVLERLQLEPFTSQTLGSLLALILGIGYATSSQVRCMCFLTLPGLCGKTGRTYLGSFVVTFIITGPIANVVFNGGESMRVMSCVASLNLNHTVERFKLMFKPVKDIVFDFIGAGNKLQEDTGGMEAPYKEIENEVRDEEETKEASAETEQLDGEIGKGSRVDLIKKKFSGGSNDAFGDTSEKKYGIKSELRCEGIFTKGVKGCYDSFGKAYDRCHSYLPVIGYLLCWPVKLTFICDLATSFMGKRSCDSDNAMTPGFGESMDTADGVQKEFDKAFAVSMNYKIDIPEEKVDQIYPQDIGNSVEHQFEKRKKSLEFCLSMINRLMACLFLQVFNVSRKYCDQYLRVVQFDNKYITSYFRHIDARRRKQGKKTLLPLKRSERKELIDPFKVNFSAEEKGMLVVNTVRLLGELTTVSMILTFDWIFYEFLMLIQRHAHVTYYQTGVHHIKMQVFGDGFIGKLARGILKGFDKKHTTDQITTTAECLPRPQKLDPQSVTQLYLLFLFLFVFIILESYALRLRRVICAFFYPKREKSRVLFLYNDRLKKRKSYLKYMKRHVRKMAKEQSIAIDTGVLFSLRHLYPRLFGWLQKLGLGKRKCLVCEDVETRKEPFVVCSEICPFCYCPSCWEDAKGKCYVCLPDDEEDSDFSDNLSEPDTE